MCTEKCNLLKEQLKFSSNELYSLSCIYITLHADQEIEHYQHLEVPLVLC